MSFRSSCYSCLILPQMGVSSERRRLWAATAILQKICTQIAVASNFHRQFSGDTCSRILIIGPIVSAWSEFNQSELHARCCTDSVASLAQIVAQIKRSAILAGVASELVQHSWHEGLAQYRKSYESHVGASHSLLGAPRIDCCIISA